MNHVKCTVAFDFINCMVVLCFGNNRIGRKGKLKMLSTIMQVLFVWLLAIFGDIMYFSINFYYNVGAYN